MAMVMRWLSRPRAQAAALWRVPGRREVHRVPILERQDELQQKGLPPLFSPRGFRLAYTDYQQLMIDELNECTAGLGYQTLETRSLVVEFARDPGRAYAFNVASMAFNNHFFFNGLNQDPERHSHPSEKLKGFINAHFSSLSTFRETFLATAEAMFGPGFVWLVQTDDSHFGSLRILTTYLAGSPLSAAHYRRQSHDLNTHNADSYQKLNKVGAFGVAAGLDNRPQKPLGGTDVVPLLCVNTWEHVWLYDHGIRGKRNFLEQWWERINWDMVDQRTTVARPPGNRKFLYD